MEASKATNRKALSVLECCMIGAKRPNYKGKRRRSTEGAQGTNAGHENAESMACVGVRLTAQLGMV
jgi:hypothetical protein